MNWSLKLGAPLGIGVYVHWTFALLLGWFAVLEWNDSQSPLLVAQVVLFILAVFGCVLLHEFGHALAARAYGIGTRDITLLPIGGVARLERMPEKPWQEFVVAIAGPAVNVAIAAVLLVILLLLDTAAELAEIDLLRGNFLLRLLAVNVFLVLFNMIPAFPMDGGRVLRAVLASRIDYVRATRIAAGIGRVLAVAFGLLGLYDRHFILVLIAFFIFIAAGAEAQAALNRSVLRGITVGQVMTRRFRTLDPRMSPAEAAGTLLHDGQRDFPVESGGELVGMVLAADLQRAISDEQWQETIGRLMRDDIPAARPGEPLERVAVRMREQGCSAVPVVDQGRLVGMLSMQNIEQWLSIAPHLRHSPSADRLVEAEVVSTNERTPGQSDPPGDPRR